MHNRQQKWLRTDIGLVAFLIVALILPVPLLADDERLIRRLGDGSVETEEWLPENMDFNDLDTADGDSQSERLQQAQAAEADGVLLGADGAFALWLSMLNDMPQDDQARAGLTRVGSRLEQRASQAFAEADMTALQQLDFDFSRFSEVPVIAALRDRIQQQTVLLENRPQADQQHSLDQVSAMLEYNRQGLEQFPEVDWLQADRGILVASLEQASQQANSADDAPGLAQALDIAGQYDIELSQQAQLESNLRSWRWQESQSQISDWLDELELELAQAELAEWDASLPGWQALNLRTQHLEKIKSLEPGDRFEWDDATGLLPTMRYVGRVDGRHLMVAETEVTISQFRQFVESTGYRSHTERGGTSTVFNNRSGETRDSTSTDWQQDYRGRSADTNQPVIHVTWGDSLAFIDWLNGQTDLQLRLPSLAEFRHYAAGGSDTRFWWGSGLPDQVVENLAGEGDTLSGTRRVIAHPVAFAGYEDGHFGPAPVASFRANPYGLYDVLGNVSELTSDCADQTEPCRQIKVAGGHWHSGPTDTMVDSWRAQPVNRASADIGFRLVMSL